MASLAALLLVGTTFSCELALHWADLNRDETSYHVERATNNEPFVLLAEVSPSTTSYIDFTEDHSLQYRYRVLAQKVDGSASEVPHTFTAGKEHVNLASSSSYKPSNDLVSYQEWLDQFGNKQVELEWLDVSDNEEGFQVERSSDGENFEVVKHTAANVGRYAETVADTVSDLWYRVCAFRATAKSSYTNIVHVPGEKETNLKIDSENYAAGTNPEKPSQDRASLVEQVINKNSIIHRFIRTYSTKSYGVTYKLFVSADMDKWHEVCYSSRTLKSGVGYKKLMISARYPKSNQRLFYKLKTNVKSGTPKSQ